MSWSQQDKGALILIADDDASQLELLEQTLLINQFTVIAVDNGVDAVAAFRQHRPDAVLLDVDMPQMDGFTACETIHREFPDSTVPIVMVTGMDDVESIEKAYAVGAVDFISKPISWPVLGHRVFYYLRGSRALNEIKARNEREQTLFTAIPDIVIHFDENFAPLDIHAGKLRHLFSDNCPVTGSYETCSLITMVRNLLKQQMGEQAADSLPRIEFEESLWLNEKLNHIEIRIAASRHNEIIVVLRDITQRKENERRIMNLVLYDQLTGLPNRRYLEDELVRWTNTNDAPDSQLALLFIHLDRMSKLYESYGLKAADLLLVEAGKRMKEGLSHVFKGDLLGAKANYRLARFGDDEFALMLTHMSDTNEAFRIGQLMQDMMVDPFLIDGHEIYLTLSLGISFYPNDATESLKLIETAGQAANLAKLSGNQISCYSAEFNEQAQRKQAIEKHLRKALEKNEFHLVYQPKLCVADPGQLSAEVLLRWNNHELGFVSPAEFIPIAEQDEVIHDISRWIVAKASEVNAKLFHELGLDVKLAINLSAQQFSMHSELIRFFLDKVNEYDMKPAQFELEITENVLIDDVESTCKEINQLRELGFSIAIDDFGTGYSSLSYLTRFNINTLKIDQSFISTFADPRSQKLIETLIVMGKKLNMQIVAEGVETEDQLAFLKHNQCDYVQGYIYAKPLTFDDFVAFLKPR